MHTRIVITERATDPKLVLFYNTSSPFSNFHPAHFVTNLSNGKQRDNERRVAFNCTEQYFMYRKAMHANDEEAARAVLARTNPFHMKKIGRDLKMSWEMVGNWSTQSRDVMYKACYEKFAQNHHLRLFLFRTHGMRLVEASASDELWGIGLSISDKRAEDWRTWNGRNWLGKTLDKVRDDLWEQDEFREDRDEIESEDFATRRRILENMGK